MSKNVKSFRQIRYIEPNDIINNKLYPEQNGSYNLIHEYDDYSISVDLEVKIPNRVGTATNEGKTATATLGNKLFNGETISFFKGTDGYLTDSPGSFTYYDILNGNMDSVNESLGITNIHIAYNSWHVPEITINFTDVRGCALMMPNEENYRRSQINQEHEGTFTNKVENFFAALFSFPYPEFLLRVKGFYGKKVEYSLYVTDFKSSFNNETGNFDAIVKFTGRMFGIYTDIPMNYLLIAPYCKYGSMDSNKTKWEEKNFQLDNGVKMPTLLEVKEKTKIATAQLEKDMDFTSVKQYREYQNQLSACETISTVYKELVTLFKSDYKNTYNIFYDGYCKYFIIPEKGIEIALKDSKIYNKIKDLHNLINEYNQKYTNLQINKIKGIEEDGFDIKNLLKDGYFFKLKKEIYTDANNNSDKIKILFSPFKVDEKYKDIGEEIVNGSKIFLNQDTVSSETYGYFNRYFKKEPYNVEEKFIVLSAKSLNENIDNIINSLEKEITSLNNTINEEYEGALENILGYKPSIKNIFKIVMAHLQIFIELYADLISNITGEHARSLEEYGMKFDRTDIPDNNLREEDVTIPPFPLVKDRNNVVEYPEYQFTKVLEETNFIDALFNGTFGFLDKNQQVDEIINEIADESVTLLPTCLTDIINLINPYEGIANYNSDKNDVDWIMTYFGIRCISRFMLENNTTFADDFGKFEAYNFWRHNKSSSRNLINKINNDNFNENNFINFLTGNKTPYNEEYKACYVNNKFKTLVTSKGSNLEIHKSDINYPAVIDRSVGGHGGIETFYKDATELNGNSFKNSHIDNYRPYNFIKFVEKNVLEEWNGEIEKVDISKVSDKENIKDKFIKNYLTNTTGIFKNITGRGVKYKKEKLSEEFFVKHDNFQYESKVTDLTEYYDKNFNVSLNSLDSIIYYPKENCNNKDKIKEMPLFFYENLTAEDFILSIPINITQLIKYIEKGCNIITIPYIVKLFLGLLIKKYKTSLNNKDEYENFIKQVTYCYENKVKEIEIRKKLEELLSFFLTNKDGYFAIGTLDEDYENRRINLSKCDIDYLGLEKEYDDWSNNTSYGGFEYFKRQYKISRRATNKENVFTASSNIKIPAINDYDLLLGYCQKVTNGENVQNDRKKHLNNLFHKIETQTTEDFTDRYSNVYYDAKTKNVYLSFNENFTAYTHLQNLFTKCSKLVLPYPMMEYNKETDYKVKQYNPKTEISNFKTAFKNFKETLLKLYNDTDSETGEKKVNFTDFSCDTVDTNIKLSTYRTLKNLYDKHLNRISDTKEQEKFSITKYEEEKVNKGTYTEFSRFHFIDTYYQDIGDKILINPENFSNLIDSVINGINYSSVDSETSLPNEMNLFSFLSILAQQHNMVMISMPIFNGYLNKEDTESNLEAMFTPISYQDALNDNTIQGPSFICFYPHEPSYILDIPNGQYTNDGFNLTDLNDTGNVAGPTELSKLFSENDSEYFIPAFGVEYGAQKQSIFKNIQINMDNPQTTEVGVAIQFGLAEQRNSEVRNIGFEGQDLFKIYSNYSYTCQVEMMGCAQIQPLMYFQLNNIPIFRGAYIITKVEHNITPGNMSTTFTGVRINKNKIPLAKPSFQINDIIDNIDITSGSYNDNLKNARNKSTTYNAPDIEKLNKDYIIPIPSDINITYDKLMNDLGTNIKWDPITTHNSKEEAFNDLNPEIRKLIYDISYRMKEFGLGIKINSATRLYGKEGASKSSDHTIKGTKQHSPNPTRTKVSGTDAYGNENVTFDKMGCALDMDGLNKNMAVSKNEASIQLFRLIACDYNDYIRQLIWEFPSGHPTSQDVIQNCIHLATLGKGKSVNGIKEIYVAEHVKGSGFPAIVPDNIDFPNKAPKNLPPQFIRLMRDLVSSGICKVSDFKNFDKFKVKPTINHIEAWCKELQLY